jgi:hypothetical protein
MLTDISTHIDLGFGITACNFRKSALFLNENYKDSIYTGEMPILYLFRHSVELFLKSLITIFHRELKIPYKDGELPFDSEIPFIKVKAKEWKEITKCHDLSTLYTYYVDLIGVNKELLTKSAPKGDWNVIIPENQKYINTIKAYDFDSTYFRYPFTKNKNVDRKKYNVEKVDVNEITKKYNPEKPASFLLIFNDEEELVEAHMSKEVELKEVITALKELSYYFDCIHSMTRATLCDWW